MSLQDKKLVFADDFAMSGVSASSNSNLTDIIDTGSTLVDAFGTSITNDFGNSGEIFLNIVCTTDFASSGSPAVTFDLHASATENMASPDTIMTVATDKTPNAGDVILSQAVPAGTIKEFLAVNAATTDALTAGKVTAWLANYPVRKA